MSRIADLFSFWLMELAFQNHMNAGGKLFLPVHPDRNGWKPPDDLLPVWKLCAPGANPEGMPVRRLYVRVWTGIMEFCLRAELQLFYCSGCQTGLFCPVGSEGEERYMLLQNGATL